MTPRLQTRTNDTGDCVRACIAGLLNLTVEDVPDFTAHPEAFTIHPNNGYEIWYLVLQQWLAGKGYSFVEIQLANKTWMPLPCETLAIFIGERETMIPNPEGEGLIPARCRHAIVGKCEGESFLPVFDPMGTNPLEAFADGKIQAVCFLVPIDPALQVTMGKALDKTLRLARQLPFSEIKDTILAVVEEAFGLATVQLPGVDPSLEKRPDVDKRIILPGE